MLVYFIKFLHILTALSLMGVVLLGITNQKFHFLQKIFLILGFIAFISGSALVYPSHFTFHTPWIMAAYLLLGTFALITLLLKKIKNIKIATGLYILLFFILTFVIHDAVLKSTFLF